MKKSFAIVAALVAVVSFGEIKTNVNLVPAIREAGLSPTFSGLGDVKRLFDGVTYRTETAPDDYRWLVDVYGAYKEDSSKAYAKVTIPADYEKGSRLVLKSYRLYRVSYWRNAKREINHWKVYGVPEGATDSSQWTLLDERTKTWSGNPTQSENNTFECANVVASGFRAFCFVPLESTLYNSNVAAGKSQESYDMELFEIEYNVDVLDYPVCEVRSECEVGDPGAYSPAIGSGISAAQTLSAPELLSVYPETHQLRGHRIERYDGETEAWIVREEVTDGAHEVAYALPDDFYARERFTWLYDELPYYVDQGPMRLSDYLAAKGLNGRTYTTYEKAPGAVRTEGNGAVSLFDGVTYLADGNWNRWLGNIKKGAKSQVSVTSASSGSPITEGDLFYLSKYRLYMLSMGGKEKDRAPTAWSLTAGVGSATAELDAKADVSWSGISYSAREKNYLEFTPDETFGFDTLLFTPINSAAHTSNPDQDYTVGLLEVDLWVNVANPKGTLRVRMCRDGFADEGFEPALNALVSEAGTLTAPKTVEGQDGRYAVSGYRLEKFDFEACRWNLAEESEDRSYDFVPDADAAYRLVWVVPFEKSCTMTVAEDALVGKESVSGLDRAYMSGETVTLTATGSDDDLSAASSETNRFHSVFVRWDGDVEGLDADLENPTLTFVADRNRELRPVFRRDWFLYLYDPGDGSTPWYRIKDGNWEFSVNPDFGKHTVSIIKRGWKGGRGELDLSTDVKTAGDTTSFAIVEIGEYVMNVDNNSSAEAKSRVKSLVLPREIVSLGGNSFRNQESMTKLVADCPELTALKAQTFARCYALADVLLKMPKLTSIEDYALYSCSFTATDLSAWDLSAVTKIGQQAFRLEGSGSSGTERGALDLPAVKTIGQAAFLNVRFVKDVMLGTNACSLTKIDAEAFKSSVIKNLTIGSKGDLTVVTNAFSAVGSGTGLSSLTFLRNLPTDGKVVDNCLKANSKTSLCKLSVSAKRTPRRAEITPLEDVEDEDVRAAAEELGGAGVWKTAEGVYKAAVIFQEMPFDPKGLLLILR